MDALTGARLGEASEPAARVDGDLGSGRTRKEPDFSGLVIPLAARGESRRRRLSVLRHAGHHADLLQEPHHVLFRPLLDQLPIRDAVDRD